MLELVRVRLADLLPAAWRVREVPHASTLGGRLDASWEFVPPKGASELVGVEFRQSLGPSAVVQTGDAITWLREAAPQVDTFLIVAPWLAPATQAALQNRGIAFADATGNVSLALRRLPVVLRAAGAQRSPNPRRAGKVGLGGTAALRMVRWLADVSPPYTLTEVAEACDLSLGYVSRLTSALSALGLVSRDRAGIKNVEWAELLRERSRQGPPLLRPGGFVPAVARRGLQATYAGLRELGTSLPILVTGSFAAQSLAPTAEAAQLVLWTDDIPRARKALSLLPTKSGGGNVILLQPSDEAVTTRSRIVNGVPHVAVSQLALDCLGGNGRLPAEGEEILAWMARHERRWRVKALGTALEDVLPTARRRGQGWTADALKFALTRMETGSGKVQARAIRTAAENDGFVTRDQVYELADYPTSRSLRGFTRPVNRITLDLQDTGLLSADAPKLLVPVYDVTSGSFQSVQGFRVPLEVVGLLRRA